MTLSAEILTKELQAFGFRVGEAADEDIYCPTYAWTLNFFIWIKPQILDTLRKVQRLGGTFSFDCDNIARRVVDRATDFLIKNENELLRLDHAVYTARLNISPFGLGLNGLKPTKDYDHITNIIRTSDKGWMFGEGQTALLSDVKNEIDNGNVIPRYVNLGV